MNNKQEEGTMEYICNDNHKTKVNLKYLQSYQVYEDELTLEFKYPRGSREVELLYNCQEANAIEKDIIHLEEVLKLDDKKPNNKKERKFNMDFFKEYLKKHQDSLMTLGVIILIDHFIFNGAFRDRIKNTMEGLLKKTEKNLLPTKTKE